MVYLISIHFDSDRNVPVVPLPTCKVLPKSKARYALIAMCNCDLCIYVYVYVSILHVHTQCNVQRNDLFNVAIRIRKKKKPVWNVADKPDTREYLLPTANTDEWNVAVLPSQEPRPNPSASFYVFANFTRYANSERGSKLAISTCLVYPLYLIPILSLHFYTAHSTRNVGVSFIAVHT